MENKKSTYLKVKDHSVSGETFTLEYNSEYDMLETFPQPSENDLPKYYESEDYISHTDSRKNILEKIYHLVRRYSLKKKLALINSFNTADKNLLDIGCGTGDFIQIAQENNWSVFGIEPNDDARKIANSKTTNSVLNSKDLLSLKKNSFDVITLWHVLEHLPNLEEQIKTIKSLLKPNGKLIVAVPNYKSFDATHYKSLWAAFDAPRHLWHFSKTSISKLFEKESMVVEKTLPMIFDAFYVSLLSEKYKSGFMNPLKAFWIGLQSNLKASRSKEHSSIIYIIKNQQN